MGEGKFHNHKENRTVYWIFYVENKPLLDYLLNLL